MVNLTRINFQTNFYTYTSLLDKYHEKKKHEEKNEIQFSYIKTIKNFTKYIQMQQIVWAIYNIIRSTP